MSASKVSSYPKIIQTLATEQKIVYLCGAGASMSLAEHRLSWPSWILAGKYYLTSTEQDELDKRIGTWSSDELIDAVTYLLEKLKTTGSYEDYMNKTVGSLHPVNKSFIDALRKIWRAGDLITTTNYDLTIEEAVNCGPVSYSFPAEILSIIRGDSKNKVIHLHGVYDRLNNIDDIVADDPQYKSVLANTGAQFIQNLISTHPIVIVGCGGTVEDPNLSGFMNFVVDKLGDTNVPYFYLIKNGDKVPELPPNALPVFYGDNYADIPEFLSEMVVLRLRRRAEANEDNESEFSVDVGMILSQVEVYDQICFVKNMPEEGKHSKEAVALVREIVDRLKAIPDGCSEIFPFDDIAELEREYLE